MCLHWLSGGGRQIFVDKRRVSLDFNSKLLVICVLMKIFDWDVTVGRILLGYTILHFNGGPKSACSIGKVLNYILPLYGWSDISYWKWRPLYISTSYSDTGLLHTYIHRTHVRIHLTCIQLHHTYIGLYGTPEFKQVIKIYSYSCVYRETYTIENRECRYGGCACDLYLRSNPDVVVVFRDSTLKIDP
jgi:hypothetical protein